MKKNVCILGSTGSVGRASLEVIHNLRSRFYTFALSCHKQVKILEQQVDKFKPKYVCITDTESAKKFIPRKGITLLTGKLGLCTLASHPDIDILINALVGTDGVYPTLEAIRNKKRIAMANKETLVAYGKIIMKELAKCRGGVTTPLLIPVDSEHSAIHQCLDLNRSPVKRIILTASGGPFLHKNITSRTTCEQALRHPVWQMGKKITIDSATLMNKGFEVIEASVLFKISPKYIEVVIHPQSIIHSAVEFVDGSIIAQLSLPDMRLPIQYALTYPERVPSLIKPLHFDQIKKLEFLKPDLKKFPCLKLAYEAAEKGGTMPCVLNAANEVAVQSFLRKEIRLTDISELVEEIMGKHLIVKSPKISDIEAADLWARRETKRMIQNGSW
ncbi:MAG: 1-deoxy-D-xylulose-5-phosphate reductoisomerase [bacterium]|nr:1-deoxy-D-xylulose-5-phosphate reductoisomerase [bacterium]